MFNPLKRPEAPAGSFLPEDYITRKAELRASFMTLALFAVVMFCVVAAFFVTNRQWLTVRSEQEAINVLYTQEAQKIEQLKLLESQKGQMLEKAEVTTALLEKVPRSVLLAELVTRMPENVVILEMDLTSKRIEDKPESAKDKKGGPTKVKSLSKGSTSKGAKKPTKKGAAPPPVHEEPEIVKARPPRLEYTLSMVGVAKVNNDIADYLAALKACPLLENVDLQYIQETTIGDAELRKFRIDAGIRKDADARSIVQPETAPYDEPTPTATPGQSDQQTTDAGAHAPGGED